MFHCLQNRLTFSNLNRSPGDPFLKVLVTFRARKNIYLDQNLKSSQLTNQPTKKLVHFVLLTDSFTMLSASWQMKPRS